MKKNLKNHFLIAMPNIPNTMFKKSVIYIFEHNNEGAMGIIINKPLKKIKIKNLFKYFNFKQLNYKLFNQPIFIGGPKSKTKGFIMHTSKKNFYSNHNINNNIIITTSTDILESIHNFHEPNNILVIFGYCKWNAYMLEQELLNNFWLISLSHNDILFHIHFSKKWIQAIKNLQINQLQLSHNFIYV